MGNSTKIIARNLSGGIGAHVGWEVGIPLRDADGQIVRDSVGKAVIPKPRRSYCKHNTVGANMLGYASYWLGYKVTPKKVAYVKYSSATTSYYGATTNTNTSAGYGFTASASWENTTGASVTLTTLSAVAQSLNVDTAFATSTISQAVAAGEVMNVDWTMTFALHADDIGAVQAYTLAYIRNYFSGATTITTPVAYASFTPDSGTAQTPAMGTAQISAGGSITDAYIEWKASATAPSGASTLKEFQVLDSSAEANVMFLKTGLTQSWTAGYSLTATFRWTWSELTEASVTRELCVVTDTVTVTKD